MTVTSWGRTYNVKPTTSTYRNNGNLYIGLLCEIKEDYGEWWEPYCDITVNIGKLEENCGAVDTNNFPQAEDFIHKYGFGEFTGRYVISGFCSYPIYKFDMDKVNTYA